MEIKMIEALESNHLEEANTFFKQALQVDSE